MEYYPAFLSEAVLKYGAVKVNLKNHAGEIRKVSQVAGSCGSTYVSYLEFPHSQI